MQVCAMASARATIGGPNLATRTSANAVLFQSLTIVAPAVIDSKQVAHRKMVLSAIRSMGASDARFGKGCDACLLSRNLSGDSAAAAATLPESPRQQDSGGDQGDEGQRTDQAK